MRVTLAEELQQEAQRERCPRWLLPDVVSRHLMDGSVRISSRHELILTDRSARLDAATIPRHAVSHVLYLPPCYLAHTPGLFEGTLLRPKTEQKSAVGRALKRGPRMKF